jgi:hypothetical protein
MENKGKLCKDAKYAEVDGGGSRGIDAGDIQR